MEQIDYTKLLPTEPPEGLVSWLLSEGGFSKEYLIYKYARRYIPLEERWEDCVEVTCTECGRSFEADKIRAGGCSAGYARAPFGWHNPEYGDSVISGDHTLCPVCGTECETVHIGSIPRGIANYAYTSVVSRIKVEGKMDRLLLTDWRSGRYIDKQGHSSFKHNIYTAWVVEEHKIVRINGHGVLFYNEYLTEPRQCKSFYDNYGECKGLYPMEPGALDGSTAENCKLDLYAAQGGVHLVAYLALWRKRPMVENLVMQGCGKLVDDLIFEEQRVFGTRKGIPKLKELDWKAKKPHQMMHMGKDDWRNWGRGMDGAGFRLWLWAQEKGLEVDRERFELLQALKYDANVAFEIAGKGDFWRALRYLKKQKRGVGTLRDYWDMAKKLHMDLDDGLVKWPRDLTAAHDKAVERYNAQKDELDNAAFADRLQKLEKMEWHSEGILIRPCATAAELRNEGKILHHCVATYADRHKRGETAIFFIRKEEAPDEPWYTLELDEQHLTVRQNRGLRNCGKTPEVQAFEDQWIEHLKELQKKNKTKKKKKEAKVA